MAPGPWDAFTIHASDNETLRKYPALAFYISHDGPRMAMTYRSLETAEDVTEHLRSTIHNAKEADSPLRGSLQLIFLQDHLPAPLLHSLCKIVNPSWVSPQDQYEGLVSIRKLYCSPQPDSGSRQHPEFGDVIHSSYDISAPGWFTPLAFMSFEPASNMTIVIARIFHHNNMLKVLARLLIERTSEFPFTTPGIFAHPLTPILLVCNLIAANVESPTSGLVATNQVLNRAGYHFFNGSTRNDPRMIEPSDLSQYTADMVASSTSIVNNLGYIRGLIRTLKFLREENSYLDEWSKQGSPERAVSHHRIGQWIRYLECKLETHEFYKAAWASHASVVIQGLQNLITQKNQDSTLLVALESRKLAEASWKDTTSVTAITLITMIFLPATFMATLFSANFVESTIYNGDGRRQATLYIAITFSLTAVVLIAWYGWTAFRQKRENAIMKRRSTFEAQLLHGKKE